MRFFFNLKAAVSILLIPIYLTSIPGCGGSTSGTGGVTVRGEIVDTSGSPLANTTIVAIQSGDTTSTDENGQFELQADIAAKLDFQIERPNLTIKSSIENIPETATEIVVRFTVDSENGSARGDTISVREKDEKKSSSSSKSSQASVRPSPTPAASASSNNSSQNSSTQEDSSSDHSESSSSEKSESSSSSSSESETDTRKEVTGQIRAIEGDRVTVESITFTATESTEYKSRKNKPDTLSGFSVGERVQAKGEVRNGTLELDELESEEE